MAYTTNIPAATDKLKASQPTIQANFNGLDSSFGVDHYPYSDQSGNSGRHRIVEQLTFNNAGLQRTRGGQSGSSFPNFPAAVAGIQQTFAALYTPNSSSSTPDTQLFSMTGAGLISQLTGNSTTNSTDGWCWLGGILIQWGQVNFSGSSQQQDEVEFKDRYPGAIPFPNNIFSVITTLHTNGGSSTGNTQNVSVFTLTIDSFSWNYTGSSAYDRFYWTAIGN